MNILAMLLILSILFLITKITSIILKICMAGLVAWAIFIIGYPILICLVPIALIIKS